jgi:hypothetical protein
MTPSLRSLLRTGLAAAALAAWARPASAVPPVWNDEPAAAPASPVFVPPASVDVSTTARLVAQPLADLRREPLSAFDIASVRPPYPQDPFQESQLLFGEEVRVVEERDAWALVEAVEQPEFSHHQRWEGYPGWVPRRALAPKPDDYQPNAVVSVLYARLCQEASKKAVCTEVPLGARVQAEFDGSAWARVRRPEGGPPGYIRAKELRRFPDLPSGDEPLRREVVRSAKLFLNQHYFWGGRTSHRDEGTDRPTGVDCSALVHLAMRVNGVDVPRDAHEQYLVSRPLMPEDLRPGDLIFLAKEENPNKIVHVMIALGGDQALEAVHEFDTVRQVSVAEKLGKPLARIGPFEPAGGRYVYLGRLLPDGPVYPAP